MPSCPALWHILNTSACRDVLSLQHHLNSFFPSSLPILPATDQARYSLQQSTEKSTQGGHSSWLLPAGGGGGEGTMMPMINGGVEGAPLNVLIPDDGNASRPPSQQSEAAQARRWLSAICQHYCCHLRPCAPCWAELQPIHPMLVHVLLREWSPSSPTA